MRRLLATILIIFAMFALCFADPSDEVDSTDAAPDAVVCVMHQCMR